MNAAVSASVVLASRLPTGMSVFALVLFSVETFALYPILRQSIQVSPPAAANTLFPDHQISVPPRLSGSQ